VIPRIAKQLGIGVESLRGWVKQAEIDEGRKPGTSTADAQRIFEREREDRELRRANDMAESSSERNDSCVSRRFGIEGGVAVVGGPVRGTGALRI